MKRHPHGGRHKGRQLLPHRPPRETIAIHPRRTVARMIRQMARLDGVSVSRLITEMVEAAIDPDTQ